MGRSARTGAGALIVLVTVFGVSMGTAMVVAVSDSERHVGIFDQVELSVMAGALEVGAAAERVVVASDVGEVLAGEGVGDVMEELEGVGGGLVAEWFAQGVGEVHGRNAAAACSRCSAVTVRAPLTAAAQLGAGA